MAKEIFGIENLQLQFLSTLHILQGILCVFAAFSSKNDLVPYYLCYSGVLHLDVLWMSVVKRLASVTFHWHTEK